jgi:hypothetical protein
VLLTGTDLKVVVQGAYLDRRPPTQLGYCRFLLYAYKLASERQLYVENAHSHYANKTNKYFLEVKMVGKLAQLLCPFILTTLYLLAGAAWAQNKKCNILVIWGDDIGHGNINAYNRDMLDYHTPNIDRIAKEGALFTDHYTQQSCTAGRASFALGKNPFRAGLLTIGMPGSDHGVRLEGPTIGELL